MISKDKVRKQGEIDYPLKLNADEVDWLYNKPFRYPPTNETIKHLIDFGYILRLLEIPREAKVLDLGVGPGWTSLFLSRIGYRVTGLDISPEMIRIARERAARERADVRFLVADMENFELNEKFDGILVYDALHHCINVGAIFKKCFEHLKSGGKLLLAEPNFMHNFRGKEAAQRFGTTERGYFPWYLKRTLRKCGFVKIRRFHNNRKRLYGNSPLEIVMHLSEAFVYRFILSLFWTQIWIRAEVP